MKKQVIFLLMLLALSILCVNVKTVSGSPDILYARLNPIHDVFVNQQFPDNNYDEANLLVVSGTTNNLIARSYLRFNLSQFSGTPLNFSLRLYAESISGTLDDNHDVEIYQVSNNTWTETTITWNDKPAYSILIDTVDYDDFATAHWFEWNITSWCNTAWAGNKLVSVMLRQKTEQAQASGIGCTFSDSEDSHTAYPELYIAYEGTIDESTNSSFYDDFEDASINYSLWADCNNTATESNGVLNCSSNYEGVSTLNAVNVQNSIIDVNHASQGTQNWAQTILYGREHIDFELAYGYAHDRYYVGSWVDSDLTGYWYVYRTAYNVSSEATLADGITAQSSTETTLRINVTDEHIYFYELYDGTLYHIANETYALTSYWLTITLFEDCNWTAFGSVEFRKQWLTESLRQDNADLATQNAPYIQSTTYTIMSLSWQGDELTFPVDARTGVTSTTTVYCGNKGKPVSVRGATSDSYNSDTTVLTITIEHASSSTVYVSWLSEASGYFLLTVHLTEGGQPLRDVTVTVHPLESIEKETHNVTTGLTGLAQFELPYGTYLVKARHDDKLKTLRVWLTGNKDVGLEFGTPPLEPRGDVVLIVVMLVVVLVYIMFMRRR